MKNVLHDLKQRYIKTKNKECYKSISNILVAINPYEPLSIDSNQNEINKYEKAVQDGNLSTMPPHPYGVAAEAHLQMVKNANNQSIILCGESGSGKTETAKLIIGYLTLTAPSETERQTKIIQQINAICPILEAFGNAKTIINDNASRFAKYQTLSYNSKDKSICGSFFQTYYLEKARVFRPPEDERNFHIPYFLYHGLSKDQHKEFGIMDPENSFYLNQGGVLEVASINDSEKYKELVAAFGVFDAVQMQSDLWKLIMGVFNLGNVAFKRAGDGYALIAGESKEIVSNIARLWGIGKEEKLVDLLCTSILRIFKKNIQKKLPFDEAAKNRDNIAMRIYENVFSYLCELINDKLAMTEAEEEQLEHCRIGILDIFGFQNVWNNSLEQFCMNYMNEKVQQLLNVHIRQNTFTDWTPFIDPNRFKYFDFVENRDYGFFCLLNKACLAPIPSAEAFIQHLFIKHGKQSLLKKINKPGSGNVRSKKKKRRYSQKSKYRQPKFDGFQIEHFGDTVAYDVGQFLEKNMQSKSIKEDTRNFLKRSKTPLAALICGAKVSRSWRKSPTMIFCSAIKELMKDMNDAEQHFVYCINPNVQKSPTMWNESFVESQLICGLFQTRKVKTNFLAVLYLRSLMRMCFVDIDANFLFEICFAFLGDAGNETKIESDAVMKLRLWSDENVRALLKDCQMNMNKFNYLSAF